MTGRGLLKREGVPVEARVWAIASDGRGNRYSPPAGVTDTFGHFTMPPVPLTLTGTDSVNEVSVFAVTNPAGDSARTARGRETLSLGGRRTRWVQPPPFALLFVSMVFFISMIVGLIQVGPARLALRKVNYGSPARLSSRVIACRNSRIASPVRPAPRSATPRAIEAYSPGDRRGDRGLTRFG